MEFEIEGHALKAPASPQGGLAICECGTYSRTRFRMGWERRDWHRQHVNDILARKVRPL